MTQSSPSMTCVYEDDGKKKHASPTQLKTTEDNWDNKSLKTIDQWTLENNNASCWSWTNGHHFIVSIFMFNFG